MSITNLKNFLRRQSWVKNLSYFLPLAWRKQLMDPVFGRFIFSKFEDARFDALGWKYVVPEPVAKNFASHYNGKKILDAYAGIGGTSIQLALAGNSVTAAEINSRRFNCLKHNSGVYGANLRLWHGNVQTILRNH